MFAILPPNPPPSIRTALLAAACITTVVFGLTYGIVAVTR